MSNLQKDLLSEYFAEYPVLRLLMPKIEHNSLNITNSLLIMRQLAWILATILNIADDVFDVNKINKDYGLTDEDINLLNFFMHMYKKNFDGTIALNLLKQNKIYYTLSSPSPISTLSITELFIALNDSSNKLSTNKINYLNKLTASLPLSFVDRETNVTEKAQYDTDVIKINNASFRPHVNSSTDMFCSEMKLIDIVKYIKCVVPLTPNEVEIIAFYESNSYAGACGLMPRKNFTNQYEFARDPKNDNNIILITKDASGKIIKQNFEEDLRNMVKGNKYCKAFGSNTDKVNCAQMYADCIGTATNDVTKCRAHFKNLKSVSENLRGWNNLETNEKIYMAYRVLHGLGIYGKLNINGDLDFTNYTDEEIQEHIQLEYSPTDVKLNENKIKYLKSLMSLIKIIHQNQSNDKDPRPIMQYDYPKAYTNEIVVSIAPGNFGFLFGNQFGGYDDVGRIKNKFDNIMDLTNKLYEKGMKLSDEQNKKINDLIDKTYVLNDDLTNQEKLLITQSAINAKYPLKTVTYSTAELEKLSQTVMNNKEHLIKRMNKIDNVAMQLMANLKLQ